MPCAPNRPTVQPNCTGKLHFHTDPRSHLSSSVRTPVTFTQPPLAVFILVPAMCNPMFVLAVSFPMAIFPAMLIAGPSPVSVHPEVFMSRWCGNHFHARWWGSHRRHDNDRWWGKCQVRWCYHTSRKSQTKCQDGQTGNELPAHGGGMHIRSPFPRHAWPWWSRAMPRPRGGRHGLSIPWSWGHPLHARCRNALS